MTEQTTTMGDLGSMPIFDLIDKLRAEIKQMPSEQILQVLVLNTLVSRIEKLAQALMGVENAAAIYDGTPEMDSIRRIAKEALS